MFYSIYLCCRTPHGSAWIEITALLWLAARLWGRTPHGSAWIEMLWAVVVPVMTPVALPTGVRGLKFSLRKHMDTCLLVALPTGVRGLKFPHLHNRLVQGLGRTPHGSAWIEIGKQSYSSNEQNVALPTGVRGLKLKQRQIYLPRYRRRFSRIASPQGGRRSRYISLSLPLPLPPR